MPEHRIHPLDGLRGIAALVVVVYHAMLVSPELWNQISDAPVTNPVLWILIFTPLRVIWAGGEAVWIFFILSGFVLVRPYLAGRAISLRHYYSRRAIRLYVPFFGSFVLATALRNVQQTPKVDQSPWILLSQLPTTFADGARTLVLFAGDSTTLNSVWWTLRWEVWFSALLPVVVLGARRWRSRGWPVVIACLALIGLSHEAYTHWHLFGVGHDNPMLYLPMFGLGVALAMSEDRIRTLLSRWNPFGIVTATVIAGAAMTSTVAILTSIKPLGLGAGIGWAIAGPVGAGGAAGVVALALAGAPLQRALCWRPLLWLGARSYTLYLIHEPLLITVAITFGLKTVTLWWIPLAIILALTATLLVYPVIERPALALVRRIPAGSGRGPSVHFTE